jgi:phospholipid/cholesterol/gamma-HCH transport system ATP-binding protein
MNDLPQQEENCGCPESESKLTLDGSVPAVEITNLQTKFGRTVIHNDLNLSIEQGEILSIVGGSGTGKTVLLRQMLGLERPTKGCVRIFGEDITVASQGHLQELRNHWGMLFQQGALYSALTVFENIAQPMPSDLSGGMIKRVALARALALEPKLLFLDEPTAGLDPDLSESFVSLIKSLHRELGLTVVMVTHDLDTLFALSTRIAVLAEKHVLAIGPAKEVIRTDHPFIKEFFLGDRGKRALAVLDEKE